MNKVYFLVPLVAILAFGGYWYSFKTAYEAKAATAAAEARHQRELKVEQDRKNHIKAIEEANALAAKRKAEIAAKQAREKKERDDRLAALDARDKARSEQFRLKGDADRLQRDVNDLKEEVLKIETDTKDIDTQKKLVDEYIAKARENLKSLYQVGDKIEKANTVILRNFKELATLRSKSSS